MSNFENATLGHTLARGFWQSVKNKGKNKNNKEKFRETEKIY